MSILLAPNGKPSNLNPEQYKLVRTPEFKAWFGDWENDPENASKIVDDNGEPLIMYSGSPYEFTIFEKDEIEVDRDDREFKPRFWFIQNKENAEDYSRKATGNIGSLYEAFLNIRNPKNDFNLYVEDNNDGSVEIRNKKIWVAIATSSNQIKLADGSNTTFDRNNPDIRFDGGGEINRNESLEKIDRFWSWFDKNGWKELSEEEITDRGLDIYATGVVYESPDKNVLLAFSQSARLVLKNGSVQKKILTYDKHPIIVLDALIVNERGKGVGKTAIEMVTILADVSDVEIMLQPKPLDNFDEYLNIEQLTSFYQKAGFKIASEYGSEKIMVYTPRNNYSD